MPKYLDHLRTETLLVDANEEEEFGNSNFPTVMGVFKINDEIRENSE